MSRTASSTFSLAGLVLGLVTIIITEQIFSLKCKFNAIYVGIFVQKNRGKYDILAWEITLFVSGGN